MGHFCCTWVSHLPATALIVGQVYMIKVMKLWPLTHSVSSKEATIILLWLATTKYSQQIYHSLLASGNYGVYFVHSTYDPCSSFAIAVQYAKLCYNWPCHDDVIKWKHFPRNWPFFAGNSPGPGEFPAQRAVMPSFDVFCDLCLNKWLSKQSWGWWFEMLSRPLWHHCNVLWNLLEFANTCYSTWTSRTSTD